MAKRNGWRAPLFAPVMLPDGRAVVTLEDAGNYITGLPAREQEQQHWQEAASTLMLASAPGDPYLGWIAILHGLQHGQPKPEAPPTKKATKRHRGVR